jgi:hypothetical protein
MQAEANIDSKSVISTLTRRAAFAGVALLAAPSTALAACLLPKDEVAVNARALARSMVARHGGQWKVVIDHESQFILIKPRVAARPEDPQISFKAPDDSAIIAAAKRYQAAQAASKEANRRDDISEEEYDPIYEEHQGSFEALLAMTPQTVAGCVAMLRSVQSFSDYHDAHLFDTWCGPVSEPGATLLSRIADALESSSVQS